MLNPHSHQMDPKYYQKQDRKATGSKSTANCVAVQQNFTQVKDILHWWYPHICDNFDVFSLVQIQSSWWKTIGVGEDGDQEKRETIVKQLFLGPQTEVVALPFTVSPEMSRYQNKLHYIIERAWSNQPWPAENTTTCCHMLLGESHSSCRL